MDDPGSWDHLVADGGVHTGKTSSLQESWRAIWRKLAALEFGLRGGPISRRRSMEVCAPPGGDLSGNRATVKVVTSLFDFYWGSY